MFGEGLRLTCFINKLVKATTANVKNSIDCSGLLSGLINLVHSFICWKHFTVVKLIFILGFQIASYGVLYLMQINSWTLGVFWALGLAEMELTFFIVSHMVLCFRFVTKNQCWYHTNVLAVAEQSLYRVKAFSFSCSAPAAIRLVVGKRLGKTHLGQPTLTGQRAIPYYISSPSAIRPE